MITPSSKSSHHNSSRKRSDSVNGKKSRAAYETFLYRLGSWAKRLALVGYVHRSLGDLSNVQAAVLFGLGTFVSVNRVIFDTQSPHGSRRYIANLAGDDEAVRSLSLCLCKHTQTHTHVLTCTTGTQDP